MVLLLLALLILSNNVFFSSSFIVPSPLSELVPEAGPFSKFPNASRQSALRLTSQSHGNEECGCTSTDGLQQQQQQQQRREFLTKSLEAISLAALPATLIPSVALADAAAAANEYVYRRDGDDEGGDLTSRLFNPDGSLRDPNTVLEAKSRTIDLSFPSPSSGGSADGASYVSADGVPPNIENMPPSTVRASYKVPTKWNDGTSSSSQPLYFDASEGKNGRACNRITVYSIGSNFSIKTLQKASTVGVAKSLQMDKLPNNYFDQGVLKADLISGRTAKKPIKGANEGEYEEQLYYEFDMAFAPLECPTFTAENLGLGFCPYDNIFLVSATVWEGTMFVCVVECNKDEWKIANSDLKRVRSSFVVEA